MACISAWAVGSLSVSVRLCARDIMICPAATTAPTGTSSRSAAFCASASASRIKYSSSPCSMISAFWLRMYYNTYIHEFFPEPLLYAVTLPVDDLDGFVGRNLEVELDKS